MKRKILVFSALAVLVLAVGFFTVHNSEEVDFSSDVKPILNKHCISCHGGVKKNGELSFLFEEEAFANAKSGEPAIIRGDAEHSNMIKRLTERTRNCGCPTMRQNWMIGKSISCVNGWIKVLNGGNIGHISFLKRWKSLNLFLLLLFLDSNLRE